MERFKTRKPPKNHPSEVPENVWKSIPLLMEVASQAKNVERWIPCYIDYSKMRLLSKECRSKDLCKEIKLYQKHKDLNKNHINYKEEILQNQNESEYDDWRRMPQISRKNINSPKLSHEPPLAPKSH